MQSRSVSEIAVGHQHEHSSMSGALSSVYKDGGIRGLWRGVSAAMLRVMFGSASQLSTFSKAKELIVNTKVSIHYIAY